MAAQVHQLSGSEAPPTEQEQQPQPSLQQLLQHSRELLAEGADQVRDIGDLAFMELELAVATSKWLLLAGVLLVSSSVLLLTFVMAALAVAFIDTVSPASVLLLCGVCTAIIACMSFLWIKSLSQKMLFRNLRQQLRGKNDGESHVQGQ